MMKRIKDIFAAVTALLTLILPASCLRVEPEDAPSADCPVTFSRPVVTSARSKAVTGSLTDYPTAEDFTVYAFYSPDDFNGWKADKGQLYMDGIKTSYDALINGWRPSQTYYWPKNGKLTFAAFSPSDASMTVSYGEDGFKFTGFEVLATQDADNRQYDLLYSERSMNRTSSTGGVSYSGADINFRHALCTVRFKFRLSQNFEGGSAVTIKAVTIRNVYTKATFAENIDTARPERYSASPEWTGQTDPVDYPAAPSSLNQAVTSDSKDLENGYDLILMPQTFDHGSDVHVTIEVTYNNGSADQTVGIDLVNGFDSD
ncbi:MAG: fimbrillin family protein, partial [Candidatus Cryptobacteroides sp.]